MPTAEENNMKRRDMKKKQSAAARAKAAHKSKKKEEEMTKTPRHFRGDWTADTALPFSSKIMERDQIVTVRDIKKALFDGKIAVKLICPDNAFYHDKVVKVTPNGFFTEDDQPFPTKIYSITVVAGHGYGYQFNSSREGKVFIN